ncbi:MAG: ZIP family metal transporter [Pseudomonadota bacterium]
MTLLNILLGTFAGGVLSVLAAASLSLTVLRPLASRMTSFSVGVLLSVAWLDMLPEAAAKLGMETIGVTVLLGFFGFFALEKVALWHHDHGHPHHCGDHPAPTGWMITVGDSLHNFVDGVLIAAAFLQDTALGMATTVAVVMHEIPQEIGDFMVYLDAGHSRREALWLNVLSSLASMVGGIIGYFALQGLVDITPYVLAVAAASFIYIAVADLVPGLHEQRKPIDFVFQFVLLAAGMFVMKLGGH